mgnify:CR=1 FL=1
MVYEHGIEQVNFVLLAINTMSYIESLMVGINNEY